VVSRCGPVPTLVEWDSNLPDWPVLKAEAAAAQAILDRCHTVGEVGVMLPPEPPVRSSYAAAFAAALIDPDRGTPAVVAGSERQGRRQALQRLPQQRHGQSH